MFSKKRAASFSRIDSLIGKNCFFDGVIKSSGTLRIDGEVKGEVISEENIFLSESGKIAGDVKATNILISGKVTGNIIATDSLRITSSGQLIGDSNTKTFVIDENAVFEGKSTQYKEKVSKELDNQKKNKLVNLNEDNNAKKHEKK